MPEAPKMDELQNPTYRESAMMLISRMIVLYQINPEDLYTDKQLEDALRRRA